MFKKTLVVAFAAAFALSGAAFAGGKKVSVSTWSHQYANGSTFTNGNAGALALGGSAGEAGGVAMKPGSTGLFASQGSQAIAGVEISGNGSAGASISTGGTSGAMVKK